MFNFSGFAMLEFLTAINFHGLELFNSVKLKKGYLDEIMPPEPPSRWINYWVKCPFEVPQDGFNGIK